MTATLMDARFTSNCRHCFEPMHKGSRIAYDRATKTAVHVDCLPADAKATLNPKLTVDLCARCLWRHKTGRDGLRDGLCDNCRGLKNETVKKLDLWGNTVDTFQTEAELNGFRLKQGALL